eukprot:1137310-Pelagomonas_calceolata.AAC.2
MILLRTSVSTFCFQVLMASGLSKPCLSRLERAESAVGRGCHNRAVLIAFVGDITCRFGSVLGAFSLTFPLVLVLAPASLALFCPGILVPFCPAPAGHHYFTD